MVSVDFRGAVWLTGILKVHPAPGLTHLSSAGLLRAGAGLPQDLGAGQRGVGTLTPEGALPGGCTVP